MLDVKNVIRWLQGQDTAKILKTFLLKKDILFAFGILSIISFLIFPVSSFFLDYLLSISIAFSVLILLTVLFIDKSLDFSAFPSILLIVTLFRLALNVSTTRLILSKGHLGPDAAGHVVEAFGYFVMQGSVIIGVIVFGILTIINFVVITKGSTRIAEVAARFSLDSMPGKQMSIDADLSAGLITDQEAKKSRKELENENTFFGAMDGASKFVRGDAIAGLLITFINFIGGIIIGVAQKGMFFDQALKTYTLLTIGDGLVAQIPALIVSIAAGLLVTKSGVKGSADRAVIEQLSNHPNALMGCGILLFFMAIMPGIPAVPFIGIGLACFGISYFVKNKKEVLAQEDEVKKGESQRQKEPTQEEMIMRSLKIDYIKIELGYELLEMVDNTKDFQLTDQIKELRKQIAKDLGFVLPPVRIQDNIQIDHRKYIIKIKDIECGEGNLFPSKLLVINPSGGTILLDGEQTKEPVFGLNAKWIDKNLKSEAESKNYTTADPITVISTHLTEIVKDNITELLTYSETQKLINNLEDDHKKLADEVIPAQISVVTLQRILQNLLSEDVTIKDFPTILESISEIASSTKNIPRIVEHVRAKLSRQICYNLMTDQGHIPVITLSLAWEQIFQESLVGESDNKQLAMPPSKLREFVNAVIKLYDHLVSLNTVPCILTSPTFRPFIRSIIERVRPNITVLSQNEIHPKATIKTFGQIS